MNRFIASVALATVLFSTAASAETFSERVLNARKLEKTPDIQKYGKEKFFPQLGKQLVFTTQFCATMPNANSEPFLIVFDIATDGTISNPESKPETNSAACFAHAIKQMKAPPAPVAFPLSMTIQFPQQEKPTASR